jgi:hypothetical protein
MSVSCECCVLSGRGLCDGGVLPSVVCLKCDREASNSEEAWPTRSCCAMKKILNF